MCLFAISVFFSIIFVILFIKLILNSAYEIFEKLNKSIVYSNMKFYDDNPGGRIMNRLSNDVMSIDEDLPDILNETLT